MNQLNTNLTTYLEGFVTEKRKNTFKNILLNRTRHFTVVLEDIFQQHNSSAGNQKLRCVWNSRIFIL
jgi:tRNA (guanosine-2'-O-)-methyltransferase